ncbi:MAG: S9 family peptidase [Acidobacteriota bacterium]
MKLFARLVLGALLAAWTAPGAAAAASSERRPITEKDLLAFRWVADPQISPDGSTVAYVLVTVNAEEDRYETSLWAVSVSGDPAPRRLTAGPRDLAPRWSPDSRTLAFTRAPAEKEKPQIFLLPMAGGEPRKWTDLPKGTGRPVWSPDSRRIAFTSGTNDEDAAEQAAARERHGPAPKKSDVRVITRAVYRSNGQGWLDPAHPDHVWVVSAVADADRPDRPPEPKRLTSGRYGESDLSWSRDGSTIFFVSDRVDEPYYDPPDSNLYAIPASGGTAETVIDIAGEVHGAVPSPDGARWAFVGDMNPAKVQSHTRADIYLLRDGKSAPLTPGREFEIGSSVGGDQHAPRGASPNPLVWSPDGRTLVAGVTEHGRSNLVRIDAATGRAEPLTSGEHDVMAWSATPDGSRFALTIGDDTHVGDLWILDANAKKLRQLTRVNDALFSTLTLSEPEEIWYPSFDGKKIHGWILKPPGFDASKKYPMILEIHGGPHSAYGRTFTHEFQWMAARGYVVLYTNPRGSTTYGEEFANVIQYRYPGDDYKDLIAGVDEVVRRGYVDAKRIGVTGGSGGGLLTNYAVTQTDRFAAAVSQRSVADWAAFWYTADFTLFTPSWFRSNPMQDAEEFWKRSPVRYADKIVTPMLFVEGDDDLRTPPSQGGEAMFRALKAQKKTAVMVRFPGETHELSRSGKPSHRVERLQHIVNWFEKYLKGQKIEAYDLQ